MRFPVAFQRACLLGTLVGAAMAREVDFHKLDQLSGRNSDLVLGHNNKRQDPGVPVAPPHAGCPGIDANDPACLGNVPPSEENPPPAGIPPSIENGESPPPVEDPPADNAENSPPVEIPSSGENGENPPPDEDHPPAESQPPDEVGENPPPIENTPPAENGESPPPNENGESPPAGDNNENPPPAGNPHSEDNSESPPPNENLPPIEIPPTTENNENPPPNENGENPPVIENPPAGENVENPPPVENPPVSENGENNPASDDNRPSDENPPSDENSSPGDDEDDEYDDTPPLVSESIPPGDGEDDTPPLPSNNAPLEDDNEDDNLPPLSNNESPPPEESEDDNSPPENDEQGDTPPPNNENSPSEDGDDDGLPPILPPIPLPGTKPPTGPPPPGDDSPSGGGENNTPEEESEDENEDEDEDCSSTHLATHASVVCTHFIASENAEPTKTECLTKPYETISDCEPVGASTTTSTVTETALLPDIPVPTCGEGTCAEGVCPIVLPQPDNVGKRNSNILRKQAAPLTTQKKDWEWYSPSNYDNDAKVFMRDQVYFSYGTTLDSVYLPRSPPPDPSSNFNRWKEIPLSLAVGGLYGCTGVVVVSRKGAWVGHFWQNKDQLALKKESMEYNEYPLPGLRKSELQDLFVDEANPLVFVMAPKPRDEWYRIDDEGVVWKNNREDAGEDGIFGDAAVAVNVYQMLEQFGHSETVFYAPMVRPTDEDEVRVGVVTKGSNGEEIFNADKLPDRQQPSDPDHDTHRGKILVQYRPGHCGQKPAWRVWIEGKEIRKDEWDSNDDQEWRSGPRRQDDSCEVPEPGTCESPSDCTPSMCAGGGGGTVICDKGKCSCKIPEPTEQDDGEAEEEGNDDENDNEEEEEEEEETPPEDDDDDDGGGDEEEEEEETPSEDNHDKWSCEYKSESP